MIEQIRQQNLQERIDTLTFEIQSLSEELEAAKKAKSQYAHELMNDPDAQERRIELLAGGYQNVSEFSEAQLAKVTEFINIIRGLERGISDRHRSIEEIQRTITAQQKRFAAESAIEPKIEKFNECLTQLREAWEQLQVMAAEHDIEFAEQALPGEASLEERVQPGFDDWLKIYFGE